MTTDDSFKTGGGLQKLSAILADGRETLVGKTVGSYRIRELIAEGGMGEVYRAVRDDGQFDRDVAIKILPPGLGHDYAQRFQQEREILASLSHPHIAQLFDSGLSDSGVLFLVMELVDGNAIDEYARSHALDTDAKTRLILTLCEALIFAHSRLVVHRDLKPSNVYVAKNGELKLLDFGIAKILDSPDDVTVQQRPMTPSYASPEQLLNEPISVASDIYQLGMLFLTLFEARDDVKPETQASATERAVNKTSVTAQSRLAERLPVELDAIINKCLRAEPAERYESAGQLAADLRNYLQGFPVAARNPGWLEKTAKFLRRHRVASAAVATLSMLLLIVNFLYLNALSQSRATAELEAEKSAEVTEFLIGLFESNDPNSASGEEFTARQILEAGALRVNEELDRQPAVRADILRAIGRIFSSLGDWDRSAGHLEMALDIQQSLYGPDDPRLADTYAYLAMAWHEAQEHSDQRLEYNTKALDLHRQAYGEDIRYAQLLTESSVLVMFVNERYDHAIEILQQATGIHDRELPADDPQRIFTLQQLMRAHERLGEFKTAQTYGEQAMALAERNFGPEHTRVSSPTFYLARIMESQGQYAEAAVLMSRVLRIDKRSYGEENPRTGDTHLNLAHLLRMSGDLEGAIDHAERSVDISRNALGADHTQYGTAMSVLGVAQQEAGQYALAEQLLYQALLIIEAGEGPEHTFTAYALKLYGALLADMGRYDEAIAAHQRGLDIWMAVVGSGKPDSAKMELALGQDYLWAGDLQRADALISSALTTHEQVLPNDHLRLAYNLVSLGELRVAQARAEDCQAPLERGIDIRRQRLPADHADLAIATGILGECHWLNGNAEAARALLVEANYALADLPSAAAERLRQRLASLPPE